MKWKFLQLLQGYIYIMQMLFGGGYKIESEDLGGKYNKEERLNGENCFKKRGKRP